VAGEADGARVGPIGRYRYEGFSLEEKFDWMHRGQGPGAVNPGLDCLAALASDYSASERALREALGTLGVDWHGSAADSAATALRAAADQAGAGHQAAANGGASLAGYRESFANLRPKIAAPVDAGEPHPAPGGNGDDDLGSAAGALSDDRKRLVEHQLRDRAANDALYAHEANTRAALDGFPVADVAPSVGTARQPIDARPGPGSPPAGSDPGAAGRSEPRDDGDVPGVEPFAVAFDDHVPPVLGVEDGH
jgi:hypothetical protein